MSRRTRIECLTAVLLALPFLLLFLRAAGAPPPVTPAPPPVVPAPPPLQDRAPTPVSAAALLPDPPRQNDPWTPPATTLPPDFLAATKTLFRQGLADPRGGEYREITVQGETRWRGEVKPTQVHGWVLPRVPGEARTFAVCWNGAVYPLVSTGGPVDLKADVAAQVRAGPNAERTAWPMNQDISETVFSPLKACLLLRLGEGALAEKVWAAQTPPLRDGDPYLRLASDWTWALFDRIFYARMQGNDPLALTLARRLSRIRMRVEGEAAERRLSRRLSFLDPLAALLADQEGRSRAPKQAPALQAGPGTFPSKAAYIAALIVNLNQVKVTLSGRGSGANSAIGSDPAVQAVVDQGEDAVEPLIQAIATDLRLTDGVSFDDPPRTAAPIPVARAARVAVSLLLHTFSFGDGVSDDADPARTAAAVRAYWDRYKDIPPAERWYRTLADDQATPAQWQEAADEIVRPANETPLGDGAILWRPQPGVVFPLRGESLRGRSAPSVSQLMARRVLQIAASDRQRPWIGVNAHSATRMALDAARWDARASVPALRAQSARLSRPRAGGYDFAPNLAEDEAAVALARVRGGDMQALSDYVAWLMARPPTQTASVQAFEPLWRSPRDPAVAAAVARLFGGRALAPDRPDFGSLLQSPLLGMAVFRRPALAGLGDKTPLGSVTVNGHGGLIADDGVIDPLCPKTPRTIIARRCDAYALQLSHLGGMPRFEFYWPLAKRDAAVAQAADRLRRCGSRFEYQPSLEALWSKDARSAHVAGLGYLWGASDAPRALLAFPRLGRPATPADVARGTAIFSLAGPGARRVWPLPRWPLPARWVTDRRYPQIGPYQADGTQETTYQQDGLVWQAEEVRQGGKWRRFFGFVGPHDIARVPAEEIAFPEGAENEWGPLFGPFDGRVTVADGLGRYRVGDPLPVTVDLRNRSGLEQAVPTDYLRVGADGRPALRAGLRLDLLRYPASVPGAADMNQSLTQLAPIRTAVFTPSSAARRLNPTEKMTALHLDLRDWYDLSRPGTYLLTLYWDGAHPGIGPGRSSTAWFRLTP